MSVPNSIVVDGIEYAPVVNLSSDLQIVVADRGWNFIGNTSGDDDVITISNAKVIRYWGTTKGLGQLALEGKQSKTILDDAGTVRIPMKSVIAVFDVDKSKWA